MSACLTFLKRQFWPLSALCCGPWTGALVFAAIVQLTAGSDTGKVILAHDNTLRLALVSLCSLYFVLAFMMWIVGRRSPGSSAPDPLSASVPGLATLQILGWGLLGILLIPLLVLLSTFGQQAYLVEAVTHALHVPAMHSGFLWLFSISTLIMTPITVVWLVWMWRAWATYQAPAQDEGEALDYEYE